MRAPADPAELEALAVVVGREAAALIRIVGERQVVGTKSSPTDVVTAADLASEALIRERLQAVTGPGTVLAEERGGQISDSSVSWVVDPLDGTVNYLYGLPAAAVSIAATVAGRVVAGAVVDVYRDEAFHASRGGGARVDGAPIAVSSPETLSASLVMTGYSYDRDHRVGQGHRTVEVLAATRDVRNVGSTALHLSLVACGRADATFQDDIAWWDYAAGALIAREAGAVVWTPSRPRGMLVAAAPTVAADLRTLVAGAVDGAAARSAWDGDSSSVSA